MRGRVYSAVLSVLLVGCGVTPLRAQTDVEHSTVGSLEPQSSAEPTVALPLDLSQVIEQPAGPPPTPRHTGIRAMVKGLVVDFKYVPSRENLMWAGVGGGLALAVHPADDNVNQALVGNDAAEKFFKAGAVLGEFPTLLASASFVYAVGRLKDEPKASHVGMDLHSVARDVRDSHSNVEIRHSTGAAGSQREELVSVGARLGHVCICDGIGASSRLALCSARLHVCVVRCDLAAAGQSTLAERRGVWLRGRHHRWPDRDEPRGYAISGCRHRRAGRGRCHVLPSGQGLNVTCCRIIVNCDVWHVDRARVRARRGDRLRERVRHRQPVDAVVQPA